MLHLLDSQPITIIALPDVPVARQDCLRLLPLGIIAELRAVTRDIACRVILQELVAVVRIWIAITRVPPAPALPLYDVALHIVAINLRVRRRMSPTAPVQCALASLPVKAATSLPT